MYHAAGNALFALPAFPRRRPTFAPYNRAYGDSGDFRPLPVCFPSVSGNQPLLAVVVFENIPKIR